MAVEVDGDALKAWLEFGIATLAGIAIFVAWISYLDAPKRTINRKAR